MQEATMKNQVASSLAPHSCLALPRLYFAFASSPSQRRTSPAASLLRHSLLITIIGCGTIEHNKSSMDEFSRLLCRESIVWRVHLIQFSPAIQGQGAGGADTGGKGEEPGGKEGRGDKAATAGYTLHVYKQPLPPPSTYICTQRAFRKRVICATSALKIHFALHGSAVARRERDGVDVICYCCYCYYCYCYCY